MTLAYRWKKSSRSGDEGACVELAHAEHAGLARDSKNPGGPVLAVDLPALLAAVRSGRLDAH